MSLMEATNMLKQILFFAASIHKLLEGVAAKLRRIAGSIQIDPLTGLLTINDEVSIVLVIARCLQTRTGYRYWNIRLDADPRADITIAIRMDESNREALDYYLLPR